MQSLALGMTYLEAKMDQVLVIAINLTVFKVVSPSYGGRLQLTVFIFKLKQNTNAIIELQYNKRK